MIADHDPDRPRAAARSAQGPIAVAVPSRGPDRRRILGLGLAATTAAAAWIAGGAVGGLFAPEFETAAPVERATCSGEAPAGALDLVFVIDSTGSMGATLDAARTMVMGVVRDVAATYPDARVGIVEYKDHSEDLVTRVTPLAPAEAGLAQNHLALMAAGGGGFWRPEAVGYALQAAAREVGWRENVPGVVILVGDARPHRDEQSMAETTAAALAASGRSVSVVLAGREVPELRAFAAAGKGAVVQLGDGRLDRALQEAIRLGAPACVTYGRTS